MPTPRPLLWDDLQLLGSARNGVSAPTLTAYRGIDQWEFSASATNQLSGSIELPHTYSDGADTFPATIFPQSFALHYRSDSDGSTAQNTKY